MRRARVIPNLRSLNREPVGGLGAAQKGKNREGLSPEMRAINTEKLHFHMLMRDRGEMGNLRESPNVRWDPETSWLHGK